MPVWHLAGGHAGAHPQLSCAWGGPSTHRYIHARAIIRLHGGIGYGQYSYGAALAECGSGPADGQLSDLFVGLGAYRGFKGQPMLPGRRARVLTGH